MHTAAALNVGHKFIPPGRKDKVNAVVQYHLACAFAHTHATFQNPYKNDRKGIGNECHKKMTAAELIMGAVAVQSDNIGQRGQAVHCRKSDYYEQVCHFTDRHCLCPVTDYAENCEKAQSKTYAHIDTAHGVKEEEHS